MRHILKILMIWGLVSYGTGCAPDTSCTVSLGSLLREMGSMDETTRWPEPAYVCRQTSSYDRRAVTPGTPEWFSNNDGFGFIRRDTLQGRPVKILFDAEGPGAITRIWLTTTNPAGTLRFYIDDLEEAAWIVPAYDLMQFGIPELGRGLLQPHTSYVAGVKGGSTLYLPIPYARRCVVALEEPVGMSGIPHYYHFNYRTYPPDTEVESFSLASVLRHAREIAGADARMVAPDDRPRGRSVDARALLQPGDTLRVSLPDGACVVTRVQCTLSCDSAAYGRLMEQLVVSATFDGTQTVWAPLSGFSGGGMGAPTVASWFLESDGRGRIVSRWPMPYCRTGEMSLCNVSDTVCDVAVSVNVSRYDWDERSLYFHACWKREDNLPFFQSADKCYDWNFVTLSGRGVYRGDLLALFNHSRTWYGEGDEKIWVDGEDFPSHFGTGVEDYYNGSWAPVVPFHTPFGGAPRADLANSQGYNAFFRTRNLDAIPFERTLKFDMEMLGWRDNKVDYATTIFWYGDATSRPHASSGVDDARRAWPPCPDDPADFRIAGAIEFEVLSVERKSDRLMVDRQNMAGFPDGLWSGQTQLVVYGGDAGDSVTFRLKDIPDGRYALKLFLTRAPDYGRVKLSANGRETVFDAYAETVTVAEPVTIPDIDVSDGTFTLQAALLDRNPRSLGTMLGFDCMTMTLTNAEP
ncbi:MAG TPA: DUF2961 domain-containing protein [Candidatus Alistipes intestinipullorum]|nr:DUF2961 domain-containing protein [Candidatus Alistipes intestinipullorum]